jgi:hypothetical protein
LEVKPVPAALFRRHDAASRTKYEEATQLARTQSRVLSGTAGTLKQRTQSGKRYWVREHIRVDGAKVDEYIGPVATVPEANIDDVRAAVALAQALAAASSTLRLLGFQRIDRKPAAVVAVLHNHSLFRAGLTVVGSHAYGVLLNELGVMAPAYRTQDLDLARAQPLSLALPPDAALAALLQESGLRFVPVPGLPSTTPAASFKLPGAEQLIVDLLVPGAELGRVVPVPELGAHAQTIPYLDFLLEQPIDAAVLSPNHIVPIKVPAPERFALHKLLSSESRRSGPGKAAKDREQAALLAAAVEEEMPGRLWDAYKQLPRAGRSAVARGARAAARLLEGRHAQGEAALKAVAA